MLTRPTAPFSPEFPASVLCPLVLTGGDGNRRAVPKPREEVGVVLVDRLPESDDVVRLETVTEPDRPVERELVVGVHYQLYVVTDCLTHRGDAGLVLCEAIGRQSETTGADLLCRETPRRSLVGARRVAGHRAESDSPGCLDLRS